jgi:hypothetical protein
VHPPPRSSRAQLAPQQLALLHSLSPDLDLQPEADAAADEEETTEDQLARRYSLKGLNSSEPRFCGPGMATAALVTRFNRGLPLPLQQLPETTKMVVLIRNPIDVRAHPWAWLWRATRPSPACTRCIPLSTT